MGMCFKKLAAYTWIWNPLANFLDPPLIQKKSQVLVLVFYTGADGGGGGDHKGLMPPPNTSIFTPNDPPPLLPSIFTYLVNSEAAPEKL